MKSIFFETKIETVIVGAFGPGSERKKEEREGFWSDLGELVGSLESDEIVCVCWGI